MTTKIYAHRETTTESKHTAAVGDVVAEIKHDLPLDTILNGLQTGRFSTAAPAKADAEKTAVEPATADTAAKTAGKPK